MKLNAKTVLIAAKIEGSESSGYIKCDLDESKGYPCAALWWPSTTDNTHVYYRLESSELSEDGTGQYDYVHTGNPIQIPKALAGMNPAPLSNDAFRLGFFFVQMDS